MDGMFSILDMATETVDRPKTAANRACDACKERKVRCDMKRPCLVCTAKGFECTYEQARKKRGPVGKRIQAIQRMQGSRSANTSSHNVRRPDERPPSSSSPEQDASMANELSLRPSTSNVSSHASMGTFDAAQPLWPTSVASLRTASPFESTLEKDPLTPGHGRMVNSTYSDEPIATDGLATIASPSVSEFIFPSLPIESPSASWDPFGALLEQQLPPLTPSVDIWPASIPEERLMPWYDVYFKRLHPTIPILNRTTLYHELLLRKHHTDRQYGAMLLGLCAFAMSQPVQIHERASIPSRSAQARMLIEECVKLRVAPEFGEEPSIEMVLTSFFLFACLFGTGSHKAARLRLREAVDLACSMGIHLPQSYQSLDIETREKWLRVYLVLVVTERAYALQRLYSIDFRGRPGMTARILQSFGADNSTDHVLNLFRDPTDIIGMQGLLCLMETFDAIDESVIECWTGYCKLSDGVCEAFDRRRALAMFRAQHRAREACIEGNLGLSPSASSLPLSDLMETQQTDICVTQSWILNRLWHLCYSHALLRISSDYPELQYEYAYEIAWAMWRACEPLSLSAMEVHGLGLVEKLYDIGMGVVTALKASGDAVTTVVRITNLDSRPTNDVITVQDLLLKFQDLLQCFRGGDHPYIEGFSSSVNTVIYGDG